MASGEIGFAVSVENLLDFRWRTHAYEISHEIKNRKEDSFKREQKLIDELNAKTNAMKDQTRIILQHENSIHHLTSERETLRSANGSLNQRVSNPAYHEVNHNVYIYQITELRVELDELRAKERGLCELLEKTEEELKTIKSEVFQLFVSQTIHRAVCGAKLFRNLFACRTPALCPKSGTFTVR